MGERDEDAAEERTDDAAEESRKRAPTRKTKRRQRAASEAATEGATGDEPSTAQTPDAPEPLPGEGTAAGDLLREATRLFAVGDYARLRAVCEQVEASAPPEGADRAEHERVRVAARALRRRTEVDPVQIVVVLACAAVFAAIVFHWVL